MPASAVIPAFRVYMVVAVVKTFVANISNYVFLLLHANVMMNAQFGSI